MGPKRARVEGASTSRGSHGRGARPQVPNFIHTTEQRNRYEGLISRQITNTRYIDNAVLEIIGMQDDFDYLFDRVGWSNFMFSRWPTYPSLVLEFMSSLHIEIMSGPNCEAGLVSFRLGNVQRQLNLAEFNAIYGLPTGGDRRESLDFKPNVFWHAIARGPDYVPTSSKSSNILNPCFRYLHRVLAHTLFGRGDSTGVVRRSELFVMWAMINGFHFDTGSYLARQFSQLANSKTGAIVLGGFVTPIAEHFGIDLTGLQRATGSDRVDLQTCRMMGMIEQLGDVYHLRLPNDITIPLPNPARVTILNQANWQMLPPPDGDDDAPPLDAPPPAYTAAGTSYAPRPSSSRDDLLQTLLEEQRELREEFGAFQTEMRTELDAMRNAQTDTAALIRQIHAWHVAQGHFPPPQ